MILQKFEFIHPFIAPVIVKFVDTLKSVHPRFEYVIAPASKIIAAMEAKLGGVPTTDIPLMSITFNYSGIDTVDHFWKAVHFGNRLSHYWVPLLRSDDFQISMSTRRLFFTFTINAFFPSSMECHDFISNILNRFIYPGCYTYLGEITTYITFTESQIDELRRNNINIANVITKNTLKSINRERYFLPLKFNPLCRFEDITEQSNFFSGDVLPEYMANGTFVVELEVPSYYIIEYTGRIKTIRLDLTCAYVSPANDYYYEIAKGWGIKGIVTDRTKVNKPSVYYDVFLFTADKDYNAETNPLILNLPNLSTTINDNYEWEFITTVGRLYPDQYDKISNTEYRFKVNIPKDLVIECRAYKV